MKSLGLQKQHPSARRDDDDISDDSPLWGRVAQMLNGIQRDIDEIKSDLETMTANDARAEDAQRQALATVSQRLAELRQDLAEISQGKASGGDISKAEAMALMRELRGIERDLLSMRRA